jgi:ribosomal protein L29
MDIKELKQKTDKELVSLERELREKLLVLRFEDSTEAVKNVREIREIKKTIARALTEIKTRSLSAAKSALPAKAKS